MLFKTAINETTKRILSPDLQMFLHNSLTRIRNINEHARVNLRGS